jgi:iron complex transport system substrate-binding protein
MAAPRSIASLLPSATEICFALGLGDRVVGVSHECDYPAEAATRPRLTRARVDPGACSAEIDRQVRSLATSGLSIYDIDEEALGRLQPELIVTQDTCAVCAVSLAQVEQACARLVGADVAVLSLAPIGLADVFDDIRRVGEAAGVADRAEALVSDLEARMQALRARTAGRRPPRVLALEWLDPPMVAGHWTPELIRAAGGDPVLAHDRAPTRARTFSELAECGADVLLVIPCGFHPVQSHRELPALLARPEIAALPAVRHGRVAVLDGNAYFNRPGPRLIDSAELAARAIHPPHVAKAGVHEWERVRSLLLGVLAGTQDAFGSTLAEECDEPPSFWQGRLRSAATTLIARVDAADAGIAVLAPSGDDPTIAGLYAVWVAPPARGCGVGDALLDAALALAADNGYAEVVLDVGDHNVAAQRLYQRWGFAPTGRRSTLRPPREHITEHELARAITPPPA